MARIGLIGSLLAVVLCGSPSLAQEIRLEPEVVYAGDIVRLSIEYRNEIPSLYALDTRALERDFEVLKVDSRTSRAFSEDGYTNRMQWDIELVPRRAGRLRLPSLAVGDWRTPALTLPVLPVPEPLQEAQRVAVEIEVEPPAPYVGQQIDLKLRVRHNAPLTRAYWIEPRIADALSFRGVDEIDYRGADGIDVNERVMVIFAASAGRLAIPAASFRGRLGGWRGDDGIEVPVRQIYRRSAPLALDLRGVPTEFGDGPWLPARALEWSQRWETPADGYRVGDSLRRNLMIEARGLPADALPANLFAAETDAYRVYPDRPRRRHGFDGRDLVARLEQSYAIILTRAGKVEFPPLRLAWWDVGADQMRELTLSGKTFVVAAAARPDIAASAVGRRAPATWIWLPALGLLMLAVVVVEAARRGWLTAAMRLWRLRAACRAMDPDAARRALLDWAEYRWPGTRPVGLWQLRGRLQMPALLAELERLDAALYAPTPAGWRGERLWCALRDEIRAYSPRRMPTTDRLAPLYPAATGTAPLRFDRTEQAPGT